LMPQRFDRATAIIDIQSNRFACAWRFVCRHFKNKKGIEARVGLPDNVNDEKFNWHSIWWIVQPLSLSSSRRKKLRKRQALLARHADKIVTVRSFARMNALVAAAKARHEHGGASNDKQ